MHVRGSGTQQGVAEERGQTTLKREVESGGSLPEPQENVA